MQPPPSSQRTKAPSQLPAKKPPILNSYPPEPFTPPVAIQPVPVQTAQGKIPPVTPQVTPPIAPTYSARVATPTTLTAPATAMEPGWAIQIGAYQDRGSTDQALSLALQKLPAPLNRGNPVIVPLRTADATWVFRARIAGYTKEQALQACRYLSDCLTISPSAN